MTETLAATIWALGLIVWVAIRFPYRRRARRIQIAAAERTLSERLLLPAATVGLAVIPAIYLATGFPEFADYLFRPWMGWLGLVVEILFLALFHASHRWLGRNWSV